jgi:hypothetical protein
MEMIIDTRAPKEEILGDPMHQISFHRTEALNSIELAAGVGYIRSRSSGPVAQSVRARDS